MPVVPQCDCSVLQINYVSAHDNETLFDIVNIKVSAARAAGQCPRRVPRLGKQGARHAVSPVPTESIQVHRKHPGEQA